ncbi:hypothetical protein Pla163_26650 [Planctomycetes bacterium Pla163]|uniref:Uncharacterized protein n=1 Tax=Rohdeia mirabilis TaxID=2528008 RepID=A0A518D222_9BACT|nr:hypothetical protein Pla163_26650 [Planctomycetes bacterium Pla163]
MTDERPTARRRRSVDERIADLEKQIEEQKQRLERKARRAAKKRELPNSIKRIPQLAKRLRAFADLAEADGRADLSTSVSMFLAGLQRVYDEENSKRAEPLVAPNDETDGAAIDAGRSTSRASTDDRSRSELTPAPRRRDLRPATEAERRFDERLRSVARPADRSGDDGPSVWER